MCACIRAVHFLLRQHRVLPYDIVIIFNMKPPQISCANWAVYRAGLPVILQYEDDVFVDVLGTATTGPLSRYHRYVYKAVLNKVSGCMAVSPHLLFQVPSDILKLLFCGVVADAVVEMSDRMKSS